HSPSVVVHDLHAVRSGICPSEAQTPLIVDANAVLAFPVAGEGFQVVARRRPQELQRGSRIKLREFPRRDLDDAAETLRLPLLVESLRIDAAEAFDHEEIV